MRIRLFLSFIAAGLLVASASQAGPLVSLTWDQDLQGISINLTGTDTTGDGITDTETGTCTDVNPAHVQTEITCPSGLLGASGSATATSYSVSLTVPFFSVNTFTTGGAININTAATVQGGAALTGTNSMALATKGVGGMVTVKVAGHVAKGVNASMQGPGPTTLVKLPLNIGVAGVTTGYFFVLNNLHYITVDFYAWTPHTLTFTGLTSKFVPLMTPTVVAKGNVALTPGGGGTVTLVSPSKISIDGPLAQRRTAGFTSLTMNFAGEGVPEPSTLLLLGAGAAGLVLVGSRKR
jgi:hypothetical protein